MGVWIVPESQVYILNLAYQEHVFRLFHERLPNRVSHYVCIPLAMAVMYAALPPQLALLLAATIMLLHLAIAVRHRLWGFCAVVLAAQVAIGAFAVYILAPFYAGHSGVWASPWLHVFGLSFIQYSMHSLEAKLPPPWGGRKMMPRDEWFRRATLGQLLLAVLAMGPHVFVEWVSGPRNLFLILLRVAWHSGYRPPVLEKMEEDLQRLRSLRVPVLRHSRFNEEITRETSLP